MSDCTRRRFLQSAAAVPAAYQLAAADLFGQTGPAEETASLQLGLVTYNWGRDWDLPTLLKNCESTGYAGVELRSTHKHGVEPSLDRTQRAEVARRFANSPVTLVGLGSACEYHSPDPDVLAKNLEETKAFVRLCHDLGGSGVKVRPNGLPADVPIDKTLSQIGESLNTVGKYAAGYGVEIRLEVHGRGTAEIPRIKQIMDVAQQKNVVVCWNCNATDLDGQGLAHNYQLLSDRMGTIHIHDLTRDDYPWKELFGLFKQYRFSGWTLVEEGRVPTDILAAMKATRAAWLELAR
jgi:sugar phosphate isomerase/epimerase